MEIMTSVEFWSTLNLELFTELVSLGGACFATGYAVGYKLYVFRRLAHQST